jgi:hypothetical protein
VVTANGGFDGGDARTMTIWKTIGIRRSGISVVESSGTCGSAADFLFHVDINRRYLNEQMPRDVWSSYLA